MENMKVDICFRTTASSEYKPAIAVRELLIQHGVQWYGQYRGDTHYAIVSSYPVSPEVIESLRGLNLPTTAKLELYASR